MTGPTPFDRLHVALVAASGRGLHWKTARAVGGARWLAHLVALEQAGAVLARDAGRLPRPRHGFWRVRLLVDAGLPVPSAPEPAPALFEPPASPPASAIDDELLRVGESPRLMNTAPAGDPVAAPRSASGPGARGSFA